MAMGANGIELIGNDSVTGCSLGASATSKISAYGATPVVQPAIGTLATTAATSTSPFGFTEAQADAILAAALALKTLGFVR